MIELFYLSSLDLMLKVEYAKKANSLSYSSHREMKYAERLLAEQYIMMKVAPKTDYYIKHPSKFVYLGTDTRLKKRLADFHHHSELNLMASEEDEVNASVNKLINDSMVNYYTEKIGELIMSARNDLKNGRPYQMKLADMKQQMNELLDAYNTYAAHKVSVNDIIPPELKPYWLGEEASWDVSPAQ